MMATKTMPKMAALAGSAVLACSAQAFLIDDAKILIDRAANTPTLTVKYTGGSTTMVELKINGTSFGTRDVPAGKKAGETSFALDLAALADGENEVEVRLYDKEGKLVGSEKSTITSQNGDKGNVFLISPKVGSTVTGTAEIKVGFGKELKERFVSFFVNNQFRSMTNNPPYSFNWDTTREANGWHEVEVWVVDGEGDTYKTRKVKVYVNNYGGGPTTRRVNPVNPTNPEPPVKNPIPAKNPEPTPSTTANAANTIITPTIAGVAAPNEVKPVAGKAANMKPITSPEGTVMMSQRNIPPAAGVVRVPAAGTNNAAKPVRPVIAITTAGAPMPKGPVTISKGTRLPDMAPLNIVMNSKPINFDVAPRIQDGIPLTPFRHLFEANGGKVDWAKLSKEITAVGEGRSIWMKIGDRIAKVNKIDVDMELAPFIERGRTIVPLSFIQESLNVDVQYDPATGHVFITKKKN